MRLRAGLGRMRRSTVVHNTLALMGMQAAAYVLPFLTVPYLARVFLPAGWGLLAFAQSITALLVLLVEFGFGLSATREAARHREDRTQLGRICHGVTGAKLLLAVLGVAMLALAQPHLKLLQHHSRLLWAAVAAAVFQSLNLSWFFQALEKLPLVSGLDISARTVGVLLIFAVVKHPGQQWLVLAIQAASAAVSLLIMAIMTRHHVRRVRPAWADVWEALRLGGSMFVFRSAVTLYAASATFILGLFFPSSMVVAMYAGAERIARAAVGLLQPLTQSLYPRISFLIRGDFRTAERWARFAFVALTGLGTLLSATIFITAPWLVRLILGPGFGGAISLLRILAWLPALVAMSTACGVLWLIPLGRDRAFNTIIVAAGLISLAADMVVAPRFGGVGLAWAVFGIELAISLATYILLRWQHLDPLAGAGEPAELAPVCSPTPGRG